MTHRQQLDSCGLVGPALQFLRKARSWADWCKMTLSGGPFYLLLSYRITLQLRLALQLAKLVPNCQSSAAEVQNQDPPWRHTLSATERYRATACRNAPILLRSSAPSNNR